MHASTMSRAAAAVAIAALLVTGCATFKDPDFPVVTKLPDKSTFANKPSVFVDAKFYQDQTDDLSKTIEVPAAVGQLKNVAEKVTKESGLFSKYTLDPFNGREMDYQIKLDMINHVPNLGGAMVSGLITGFSLFIIPGVATDNYVLRASVVDKTGNVMKKYEYRSHVTTWFGIWMLPFAGNSPMSVVPEHWENMIKRAYEQIVKDNMLRYSAAPSGDRLAYAMPREEFVMTP